MAFKSGEPGIEIPYELFSPRLPTIYRKGVFQQILNDYRRVVHAARSAMAAVGGPFDIRPAHPSKNVIVAYMCRQYRLPRIDTPCTVRRDAWAIDAHRKYLSNIYLPEFG